MAVLGVDDFKSKLRGGGARPNLFKATINYPGYAGGDTELTSFLCETAQLPGSTFGTIVSIQRSSAKNGWRSYIRTMDSYNHQ
jgi:hypothetical protein